MQKTEQEMGYPLQEQIASASKTKYTRGPWRVGDAGSTVFGPPTDNPVPVTIASIAMSNRTTREEKRANARLISQAPTMASVLQDSLESLKRLPDVDGAYRVTVIQEIERVLSAIDGK